MFVGTFAHSYKNENSSTLAHSDKIGTYALKPLHTMARQANIARIFLKTLDHNKPLHIAIRPEFFLKTLAPNSKHAKHRTTPQRTSQHDEKHFLLTRPRSFASPARSHARHEHETRLKPMSRLGSPASISSPQSPILNGHLNVNCDETFLLVFQWCFPLCELPNEILLTLVVVQNKSL